MQTSHAASLPTSEYLSIRCSCSPVQVLSRLGASALSGLWSLTFASKQLSALLLPLITVWTFHWSVQSVRENPGHSRPSSEVLLCFSSSVYWETCAVFRESCLIVWEFEGGPQNCCSEKKKLDAGIHFLKTEHIIFLEQGVKFCFIHTVTFKAVEIFMGLLPSIVGGWGLCTHSSAFRPICCLFVLHKPKGQSPHLSGTFIS